MTPILGLTSEAELMRRGDTLSLGRAITDSLSEQGGDPEYLKGNILSSIETGKFNEAAVPLLNQLVSSDQVKARLTAARALMSVGAQSCAPSLRNLLSDSDQGVRYVAAIALADINNMPDKHPSIQEFQEHEEKYIGYWKK
jgi:HEAT repeat protein